MYIVQRTTVIPNNRSMLIKTKLYVTDVPEAMLNKTPCTFKSLFTLVPLSEQILFGFRCSVLRPPETFYKTDR